jgi:perosamine synthetase
MQTGEGLSAHASPVMAAENRESEVYRAAVARHFGFLKAAKTFAEAIVRAVELPNGEGLLVPLCEAHVGNAELIETLSRWREANADAFPSRFTVTTAGTSRWLRDGVLNNPGRLTFLVFDKFGKPIGHMGLANADNPDRSVEIDNVVRGEIARQPGLMGSALEALLSWTDEMLLPAEISLRVFKDNDHAIKFYDHHGFVPSEEIPLKKVDTSDGYVLEPSNGEPTFRTFLRMQYRPSTAFDGKSLILTAGPTISALEASYANDATRHGWNSQWSGYLDKFEKGFAEYIGVKHAIATSSGTGALHIALMALGVGPGDEVIVPDLTWVATGNAVVYCGATPIFADVEPISWTLDPAKLERHITSKTKAIMPVHLYGQPADMDAIMSIANAHNLPVVEDAAPAIGAECRGRKVGGFGSFGMFSFQGAKLVVTGEGGMLVTNDDELYDRAHFLWDQGRVPGTFWIEETGWKYKMSNIQAAIGLGQIERAEELIEAKRRIHNWYCEDLSGIAQIELSREAAWARSICWMTSITLADGLDREAVRKALKERSVDTRPAFPAISGYPMWPVKQPPQPVAQRIGSQSINLPSGHRLTRAQVRYVATSVREVLAR